MARRKVSSELDKAEIRLESLMDKRADQNTQASLHREERNMLNQKRRDLVDHMRALKAEREPVIKQMQAHRRKRNALQKRARELIDVKRKRRGDLRKGVGASVGQLRREVVKLQVDQETTVLTIEEENELLETLRTRIREMREVEAEMDEQDKVIIEVKEVDGAIDECFAKAEEEHKSVIELAKKNREINEKITVMIGEISILIAEANKKHEEFVLVKAKADAYHQKVIEMRSKVLAVRNEGRMARREGRKELKDHQKDIRKRLDDPKKKEEAADAALEDLLKKGKVEIRG
jgi:phosphoserine phosphatase